MKLGGFSDGEGQRITGSNAGNNKAVKGGEKAGCSSDTPILWTGKQERGVRKRESPCVSGEARKKWITVSAGQSRGDSTISNLWERGLPPM